MSKKVQKSIRNLRRRKKKDRIGRILKEFRGLRQIADARQNNTRRRLGSVYDAHGELQTDRVKIADVFAEFYENSYSSHGE